jgi:hypothetical protein
MPKYHLFGDLVFRQTSLVYRKELVCRLCQVIYNEDSRRRRVTQRGRDGALVIVLGQISIAFDEKRVGADCVIGGVEIQLERTEAGIIVQTEYIPVLHLQAVVLNERRGRGRWEVVRRKRVREGREAVAADLACAVVVVAGLVDRLVGEPTESRQIPLRLGVGVRSPESRGKGPWLIAVDLLRRILEVAIVSKLTVGAANASVDSSAVRTRAWEWLGEA